MTLTQGITYASPPKRRARVQSQESTPTDTLEQARAPFPSRKLEKAAVALAGLAVSVGTQNAQAAEAVLEEAAEEETADQSEVIEAISKGVDTVTDAVEVVKSKVDQAKAVLPEELTERQEIDLGQDWQFHFEALDVDLKPKWRDGPALRLKGDFLETGLRKVEDLGDGWKSSKGIRAELQGEVNSYESPRLDLSLQAYKRWEGPIAEDFDARFDVGFGLTNRFMGEGPTEGLSAGIHLRQELEGGKFQVGGYDLRWYLEAREGLTHNFSTGDLNASYKVMVGPKKDFSFKVFGRKGRLTLTVGPEVKGKFGTETDPFSVGVKAKTKIRF